VLQSYIASLFECILDELLFANVDVYRSTSVGEDPDVSGGRREGQVGLLLDCD